MDRPNLVFVLADQLRYQSCGYAGDGRAHTPNMDRLAEEGVSYSGAISGHPVCAPFRASLFTGKYSSSTGMVINELRMNPRQECFAHVLSRAGYETAYIGKWHLWANELGNHSDPKNAAVPSGPYRLGFDGLWSAYNFHHRYYGACHYGDSREAIPVPGFEPDGQTDMAIDFLSSSDRPFALFLSYGTPHDPWSRDNLPVDFYETFREVSFPRPPNYIAENDPHADGWGRLRDGEREQLEEWMRVYYGMTANLDKNLGRLLKAIEELGLEENTLLVFTSDHGEMFGAHGRKGKNIFYEEAVRVPFLMRWPARIPAGREFDTLLNTPDIMPTLLALMNLPVPSDVEGVDLNACDPECAFLQGMGSTAAWVDGHEWRAVRTHRHTYATYLSDGNELLFDNVDDPFQMKNLVNDLGHRDIASHLKELMGRRMAELEDGFERCTWYRDHWTEDRIILRSATL